MEKIKIYQDDTLIHQQAIKIESAIRSINDELKDSLESIGFELTAESYADCLTGASAISQEYKRRLEKDVAKLGTLATIKMFKEAGMAGYEEFDIVRKQIIGEIAPSLLKYITVLNGIAVFTATAKSQLQEDCTTFISEPLQVELYRKHLAACAALNSYFQGVQGLNWANHFVVKDGSFAPEAIDYGVLIGKIKSKQSN